jgi:DivIVA domain-containing protein
MRGERWLLRAGECMVSLACRHLPAEKRDERYREWAAELPAILHDPEIRLSARRAARMLRYAADTIRGTALAPGKGRRFPVRRMIVYVAIWLGVYGLLLYIQGWPKTPWEWIYRTSANLAGIAFWGLILKIGGYVHRARRKVEAVGPPVTGSAKPAISAEQAIRMARDITGRLTPARWRPCYRIAEVDELIARIEATLTGTARPAQVVTAADVQAVKFGTTRGTGYDESMVDDALDYYADALGSQNNQCRVLKGRAGRGLGWGP